MTKSTLTRVASIDTLRGLVMVIMALDHIRDLFHADAARYDPLDLSATSPLLFFTRWTTHLCAPTFVFLAGTSVFLSLKRKADLPAMRKFLFTRGLWLILLEFTVITFGIWTDVHFSTFLFQVIATIGVGFIVLSALLSVNATALGLAGLAIIFLHNLVPLFQPGLPEPVKTIVSLLFQPGFYQPGPDTSLVYAYPPVPWLGIMLAGYGFGQIFLLEPMRRKSILLKAGLAALLVFAVLRFINTYGDPAPWKSQKGDLYTFMSFMNVTKYAPSLLYTLVTIGISFLLLYVMDGAKNTFTRLMTVYGKVPFFYYLVHWYLIHAGMCIMLFLQGFTGADFRFGFNFGRPAAPNGLPLWGVYLVWLTAVVLLYPLCARFGKYKESHRAKKWLSYL